MVEAWALIVSPLKFATRCSRMFVNKCQDLIYNETQGGEHLFQSWRIWTHQQFDGYCHWKVCVRFLILKSIISEGFVF